MSRSIIDHLAGQQAFPRQPVFGNSRVSASATWPIHNSDMRDTLPPYRIRQQQQTLFESGAGGHRNAHPAFNEAEVAAIENNGGGCLTGLYHLSNEYPVPHRPAPTTLNADVTTRRQESIEKAYAVHEQGFSVGVESEIDALDDHPTSEPAAGKRGRSHKWPALSGPLTLIIRPTLFETRSIGETGRDSGRNMLALFHKEGTEPRTKYNVRIMRGRALTYLPSVRHYPACSEAIPGGLTLTEICCFYPRHVWGTGLRVFIAESWTGQQVYDALPADFKISGAAERPWNYIQQGFTREVDRMNQESGVAVEKGTKRKRTATIGDANSTFEQQTDYTIADDKITEVFDVSSGSGPSAAFLSRHPALLERRMQLDRDAPGNIPMLPASTDTAREKLVRAQEDQLLKIMTVTHPEYSVESPSERLDRVRNEHVELCRRYEHPLESLSLLELVDLTEELQSVVENFSKYGFTRAEADGRLDDNLLPRRHPYRNEAVTANSLHT